MTERDDDLYCRECGEDDKKNLAFEGAFADSFVYTCRTCGARVSTYNPGRDKRDS